MSQVCVARTPWIGLFWICFWILVNETRLFGAIRLHRNYRVAENGSKGHRQIPNAATRNPLNFQLFIHLKIYEAVETAFIDI
jgi:hypothetical protein